MTTAVLSLGANLGDRFAALQGALDALAAADGVTVVAASHPYETDPVGGPEQPRFLNAVVLIETTREPMELLELAQGIEQEWHRVRDVRWGPRTLDVDIIDIEGIVSDHPVLTLPHPRAAERAFVLVPWREVQPDAELAGRPITAIDVDDAGVRRLDQALAAR